MSAAVIKTDLTDLVSTDMTGQTTGFFKVLSTGGNDYLYDSAYSGSFNSPFIVEHTGGGGGAWYALGVMDSTSFPTGIAQYAISVRVLQPASGGGNGVDRIFYNGGGGSNIWLDINI